MPQNEEAWGVWARYGWSLIAWDTGRFLLTEAMGLLATLGVENVEGELFNLALIARVYLEEESKKRKTNE